MDFEWLLAIFCLLDGRTFLLCMLIGSLVSRGFSHVLLSKQCVFQYPPLNEVSCVSCESSRLLISPKHHIFFAPTNELWNIVLLFTVKNRLSSRNPDWICFNFCMLLILSWTQILRARLFSQVLDSRRDREPLMITWYSNARAWREFKPYIFEAEIAFLFRSLSRLQQISKVFLFESNDLTWKDFAGMWQIFCLFFYFFSQW